MDKKFLRKMVRDRLSSIPMEEKGKRSAIMSVELGERLSESSARVVALFSPLSDEPHIWDFVESLSGRVQVALPRVEGDVMRFYRYVRGNLEKGSFGIMEPDEAELVTPGDIDVMVVPGVAFTEAGARMGRGRGYYDKYMSLPGFWALKIGVCFREQLVDCLPVEAHDIVMDAVVVG